MRYEIQVEPIAGFAAHAAANGDLLMMAVRGLFTPADGRDFYVKLDGFASRFLQPYLSEGNSVSTIDHALVVLRSDYKATVYVNELPIIVTCIAKGSLEAGQPVTQGDIAAIGELKLPGVSVPENAGILFYFSLGWRKGFFFDLLPLQGEPLGNVERVLGQAFQKLWFSELFSIPESMWPAIFAAGWFPFVSLIGGPFEELVGFLEQDILHAWEEKILARFDSAVLQTMLEGWATVPAFNEHITFFTRAVERYLAGDYLSAIGNAWPRIEGILRYLYAGPIEKPGQKKLLANMQEVLRNESVVPETYFPALFQEYLLEFYYRDFSLNSGAPVDLTRHSHAHGVAPAETYDRKKALVALLIVQQLFYYLKLKSDPPAGT